jgi:SAM-dependent methyltransferase
MLDYLKNLFKRDNPEKNWLAAQEGEYAFWKGISETGYNDLLPDDFIAKGQRDWLLGQLEFTGKPLDHWKDSVVVEFGPGPAGIIEYIQAREVHGVEPLIEKYRNDYPHLQRSKVIYHSSPAEDVPAIPDALADLVICFNMLDHTIDPVKVMNELSRIAKPGADFLFQLNLYKSREEALSRPSSHAAMHPHVFFLDDMERYLQSFGFQILKSHCRDEPSPCGEYFFIASGCVVH